MARFSLGPGYLKVMKNNSDNPLTTPNTDRGKFLFNSEEQNIGYIDDIFSRDFDGVTYPNPDYLLPGGSTASNFQTFIRRTTTSSQEWVYSTARNVSFNLSGIPTPMCEVRPFTGMGVTRVGPRVDWTQTGAGGGGAGLGYVGYILGTPAFSGTLNKTLSRFVTSLDATVTLQGGTGHLLTLFADNAGSIISVWDLPATSIANPVPTGTPSAGQRNVLINDTQVKVSRPGFHVGTATGRQLILDSDRVPAKIAAAGEVTIASGANVTIPVSFPLTALAYMDYHVRRSTDSLTHPPFIGSGWTDDQKIGLNYRVNANSVTLYNVEQYTLVVRYMICVDDASGNTSGGSRILRPIGDDVQIKRPGSSDSSPSMSEILLDTRLAYIPIIDDAYIPLSQFSESPTSAAYGTRAKTISFSNPGDFRPFVKYMVHFADGSIRAPISKLLKAFAVSSGFNNMQASNGTVAIINNTSVKFHLANNNPTELRINDNGNVETWTNPDDVPTGLRYYIFGIPVTW